MENIEVNPTEQKTVQNETPFTMPEVGDIDLASEVPVVEVDKCIEEFTKLEQLIDSEELSESIIEDGHSIKIAELQQLIKESSGPIDIVTKLLIKGSHPEPEYWKRYLNENAVNETPELQMFLVKRAIHLSFISVTTEDVTNHLLYVNTNADGVAWYAVFDNYVVEQMIRLKL